MKADWDDAPQHLKRKHQSPSRVLAANTIDLSLTPPAIYMADQKIPFPPKRTKYAGLCLAKAIFQHTYLMKTPRVSKRPQSSLLKRTQKYQNKNKSIACMSSARKSSRYRNINSPSETLPLDSTERYLLKIEPYKNLSPKTAPDLLDKQLQPRVPIHTADIHP